MKPNVYLYILVMAGVTYLIRMLPLVLFKREITSPECSASIRLDSVLCAICMSCCYDISGNPDSNGRRDHFRCGGTHCSTDRGIS